MMFPDILDPFLSGVKLEIRELLGFHTPISDVNLGKLLTRGIDFFCNSNS